MRKKLVIYCEESFTPCYKFNITLIGSCDKICFLKSTLMGNIYIYIKGYYLCIMFVIIPHFNQIYSFRAVSQCYYYCVYITIRWFPLFLFSLALIYTFISFFNLSISKINLLERLCIKYCLHIRSNLSPHF